MAESEGSAPTGGQLFVVAVDFAECSRRALAWADERARRVSARLHVVHVLPPTQAIPTIQPGMMPPVQPNLYQKQRASAEEALGEFVSGCKSPCSAQVVDGEIVKAIVSVTEKQTPELLVMGTHGRSGVERLVLGSVSESVLRNVKCPVIVVPQSAPLPTPAPDGGYKHVDR